MSVSYLIVPGSQAAGDRSTMKWLRGKSITIPDSFDQGRFPTVAKLRSLLKKWDGVNVAESKSGDDLDFTVTRVDRPSEWCSLWAKGFYLDQNDSVPCELFVHRGSQPFVVALCERVSQACGPLVLIENGESVRILQGDIRRLTRCIDLICERIPEFEPAWRQSIRTGDEPSGACGELSIFVDWVGNLLENKSLSLMPRIFSVMEFLLSTGTDEAKEAVATCFLESLQNLASSGRFPATRFVPYLGPLSRKHCEAWDAFTDVQTEGLEASPHPRPISFIREVFTLVERGTVIVIDRPDVPIKKGDRVRCLSTSGEPLELMVESVEMLCRPEDPSKLALVVSGADASAIQTAGSKPGERTFVRVEDVFEIAKGIVVSFLTYNSAAFVVGDQVEFETDVGSWSRSEIIGVEPYRSGCFGETRHMSVLLPLSTTNPPRVGGRLWKME
jgi:hypothetical protein